MLIWTSFYEASLITALRETKLTVCCYQKGNIPISTLNTPITCLEPALALLWLSGKPAQCPRMTENQTRKKKDEKRKRNCFAGLGTCLPSQAGDHGMARRSQSLLWGNQQLSETQAHCWRYLQDHPTTTCNLHPPDGSSAWEDPLLPLEAGERAPSQLNTSLFRNQAEISQA